MPLVRVRVLEGKSSIERYIFEEQGWIPTEFHNGFGMITINGVPKPAFALPSSLQEEISGTETIPNHCSRSVPFFLLTCKIL